MENLLKLVAMAFLFEESLAQGRCLVNRKERA